MKLTEQQLTALKNALQTKDERPRKRYKPTNRNSVWTATWQATKEV